MRKYTDAEVLAYWDNNMGTQSTRKRSYVDPRNYLIALLYFKFGYIEEELADIFEIHRSSVNHAKRAPYDLIKTQDETFLKHTSDLAEEFPYIFPKVTDVAPSRLYAVNMRVDRATLKSLQKYSKTKNRRINQVAVDIITKHLKQWDA